MQYHGIGQATQIALQTALDQLGSGDAQSSLTVQGRNLKTLIERQLSSRHAAIDIRAA